MQSLQSPSKKERGSAMIGYFFILWFIPILESHKSEFVFFHAKQAMILFFVEILSGILCILVSQIPYMSGIGSFLLGLAIFGFMILSLFCMLMAMQGKKFEIPVLAEFAKQLNF